MSLKNSLRHSPWRGAFEECAKTGGILLAYALETTGE
jgi:hypothetical protein